MHHYLFRKSFIVGAILLLAAASFTFTGENRGIKNPSTITGETVHQQVKQNLVENVDIGKRFQGIQDAIDDPDTSNGHTLFVHIGIYQENVLINKSLNIIGENRNNTFIVGEGPGNIVTIMADGVSIRGFTIQHCQVSIGPGPIYAGIKVYSNNNVFDGNNIQNCDRGFYLYGEITGNSVSNNIITNCPVDGILLFRAFANTLYGNDITTRGNGILLVNSYNNSIYDNTLRDSDYGIYLVYSSNDNTIYRNNFLDTNWYNVHIDHTLSECTGNQWDTGFSSFGNDWSDHTGVDPCSISGRKDGPGFSFVQEEIVCGDANGDDDVTIGDYVFLYEYLFNNGPAPDPLCRGDANGSGGTVTIGDYVYIYYYLFYEGPAPVPGCCSQ